MTERVIDKRCPFCGAEVIPLHEYGKEEPQRLVCCRLVPNCGAQFDLAGIHIGNMVASLEVDR